MAARAKGNEGPYLLELHLVRDRVPSFADFPFSLPAVRNLHALPFHPRVTFLIGENGTGKSTLLEAVAVQCGLNPEGGSRNFHFATRESHSRLDRYVRLAKTPFLPLDCYFLRAESFYNLATEVDKLEAERPGLTQAYGGRSLHEQSHGESFFALFENRFHGAGLYLMDEPEAALSPSRQMSFLALLHRFCQEGAQFVIATHSPIIMAYPDAWIYVLGDKGPVRTPYDETEHFRVTRAFLANPRKMVERLLEEDEEESQSQCSAISLATFRVIYAVAHGFLARFFPRDSSNLQLGTGPLGPARREDRSMLRIWRRVAARFAVTDEEHVQRIRRVVGLHDRWRWPLLILYGGAAVGFLVVASFLLPGLMQGANIPGLGLGFAIGAVLGAIVGGLALKIGHGLVIALASLRTERLLLRYHDALTELAQESVAECESVESRA